MALKYFVVHLHQKTRIQRNISIERPLKSKQDTNTLLFFQPVHRIYFLFRGIGWWSNCLLFTHCAASLSSLRCRGERFGWFGSWDFSYYCCGEWNGCGVVVAIFFCFLREIGVEVTDVFAKGWDIVGSFSEFGNGSGSVGFGYEV